MRAHGRDIVELFGYAADDVSSAAVAGWNTKACPFTGGACTKTNHDKTEVYGTCSVSHGVSQAPGSGVIICPKRLYGDEHSLFNYVLQSAWPNQSKTLISRGTLDSLERKARCANNPVVAFGQGSGKEIAISSNGQLSMDWVLQSYTNVNNRLIARDFVGLEVQSIDITGNYRENWGAYRRLKEGQKVVGIPSSEHGLNWANVHKRLIPQIIRKGNIYAKIERCSGFFFILPDAVYKVFENVIGDVPPADGPSRKNLSVITFKLDERVEPGVHRPLRLVRQVHYSLGEVAAAFIANLSEGAPDLLDSNLRKILG